MLPVIRARIDARQLARKLRQSLVTSTGKWKIDSDEEDRPALSSGDFRILLVPRAIRILDAIHVYHDGAEIWLPLVARLRLRAAARLHLIQDANEGWEESERKKTRAPRRQTKSAA